MFRFLVLRVLVSMDVIRYTHCLHGFLLTNLYRSLISPSFQFYTHGHHVVSDDVLSFFLTWIVATYPSTVCYMLRVAVYTSIYPNSL
jgi:hypothetical protein